jgi:outer membrane receptor for ferrienterochelin and colicin
MIVKASVFVPFLLFSLFESCLATGGYGTITGTVYDYASRRPLSGASIYIPDLHRGTISAVDGTYHLRIPAPVTTVVKFTFIGYETKSVEVHLEHGEEKEFIVYMNPQPLMRGTITITGSRIRETTFDSPHFITVASKDEMSSSEHTTTADLLKDEPGVLVQKTTHGHGAPIIRGLIGRHVLILFNGIRLNRPTFRMGGNQYMNTVIPEALNRIEISRGPSSVLYGSDALGGTINLVSDPHERKYEAFSVQPGMKFDYSSADDSKAFSLILSGGSTHFAFAGNLLHKKTGDLDPGGDAPRQVPTGWDELDGSIAVSYSPVEQHAVTLNYLNVNQNGVPRYDKYANGTYRQYIYDPQDRRLLAFTYVLSPPHSWLHELKCNISFQEEHEARTLQKVDSSVIRIEDDRIETFGTYINCSSILSRAHWVNWGGEYYRDILRSSALSKENGIIRAEPRGAYPDSSVYHSLGLYAHDNCLITPSMELGCGIRYSYIYFYSPLEEPFGTQKSHFHDLTGSASIRYRITATVNGVVSYSRGFRAPNFNDTVALKVSSSGVDAPSPDLTQESSHNFELGLKLESERSSGRWFVFYNYLNDLIERRPGLYGGLGFFDDNGNGSWDPGEAPIYQKFNSDEAVISGTELSGSTRIGSSFILSGHLCYIYGQNTSQDEPMSRIPPLMVQMKLKWQPARVAWVETSCSLAAKQDRLSTRDKDDTRIPGGGTPGYGTFSIKCVYAFTAGKLMVAFQNVFDELYKTHGSGVYAPGRHIALSLQLHLPDQH